MPEPPSVNTGSGLLHEKAEWENRNAARSTQAANHPTTAMAARQRGRLVSSEKLRLARTTDQSVNASNQDSASFTGDENLGPKKYPTLVGKGFRKLIRSKPDENSSRAAASASQRADGNAAYIAIEQDVMMLARPPSMARTSRPPTHTTINLRKGTTRRPIPIPIPKSSITQPFCPSVMALNWVASAGEKSFRTARR